MVLVVLVLAAVLLSWTIKACGCLSAAVGHEQGAHWLQLCQLSHSNSILSGQSCVCVSVYVCV